MVAKDVYCDQSLGAGGNDDGTTWEHAYRVLSTALNGSNVLASDRLFVKNNASIGPTETLLGTAAYNDDPLEVIGCLPAASNEPPLESEIIPGFRTGQSTFAYAHADAPTLTITTNANHINISGWMRMYGLVLKAEENIIMIVSAEILFEECEIRAGDGGAGVFVMGRTSTGSPFFLNFVNSKLSAGTDGSLFSSAKAGRLVFEHCIIDVPADPMVDIGSMMTTFDSCDFSSQSGAIINNGGGQVPNNVSQFLNCKFHASSALESGSVAQKFRTELIQCSSVTGKSTGASFQEITIITNNGKITEELTGVRGSGADDGGTGGWALAFEPYVDGTRNNREGLVGPWIYKKVAGDGTSQNLTIFIANDEGVDYQTDDAHAEVHFPSADGGADYDRKSTQLNFMASPADITDDVVSSWTTPAANPQKFVIPISPKYTGRLRWRVIFTRNFGATPKKLYVDGLTTIT